MRKKDPTRGVGWGSGFRPPPPNHSGPADTKIEKEPPAVDSKQPEDESGGGWRNPDLEQ